jgi:hypothetical protein
MSLVHGVCWWGHFKIHKNDTSKALQCTYHVVLLGYATIKLAKLKIVNDTVTSIIGKRGKLRRILSDAFKCIEVGLFYMCNNILTLMTPLLCISLRRLAVKLSYVCNNISTPMAPLLNIRLRWDLLIAARFLQVQ